MAKCEVCGKNAEIHHIVNKCQGGFDFRLNYKYLCAEHHRGKNGPHKNSKIDIRYKIDMQKKLEMILDKYFYTIDELEKILYINKNRLKKILKNLKFYKEGYKREDIIYRLMGNKRYEEYMLEDYDDFIPLIGV